MGDSVAAVLSLRRSSSDPFTEQAITQITEVVEPYAGALLLVRNAHRNVVRHTAEAVSDFARVLFGKGHWGRKLITAALVLFAGWFCFGRMDYSVTAQATIVPGEMRHITMPFEGIVASTSVKAGDSVDANAMLCRLDARDLEIEKAELQAELEMKEREFDAALAEARRVDAQLAAAERELLLAKLAGVERKLAQCEVRSPYAGVVVAGDLDTLIGAVLPQGEGLFQVAPLTELELEVELQEHQSQQVAEGMSGEFISQARPETSHDLTVDRVHPSSEQREDRNVFVGKSLLNDPGDWLRPGMEGVVRIEAGPRPVWWVTFHRVIDWLRVNFWL
jgi:multidrug efflux pump subunit AcrA (membrane-fusion protein)